MPLRCKFLSAYLLCHARSQGEASGAAVSKVNEETVVDAGVVLGYFPSTVLGAWPSTGAGSLLSLLSLICLLSLLSPLSMI